MGNNIYTACKAGDLDSVKKLLTFENINQKYSETNSNRPIHYACESGNLELIKYLIGKGAELDSHCLERCVWSGELESIKYVLERCREKNIDIDNNCLEYACNMGNSYSIVYTLMKNGVRWNTKEEINKIFLRAISTDEKDNYEDIIDIDFAIDGEFTLLTIAARTGNVRLAKRLCEMHCPWVLLVQGNKEENKE